VVVRVRVMVRARLMCRLVCMLRYLSISAKCLVTSETIIVFWLPCCQAVNRGGDSTAA